MQRVSKYRASSRLNYSTLKLIYDDPYLVKWRQENPDTEDEETVALRLGSAIDCMLTTPNEFTSEFWVSNDNRPWGLMGSFIDNLSLEINEDSPLEDYEDAYRQAGYKISIETVVKQLWAVDKYRDFFLARKAALGKTVLSKDEYDMCLVARNGLLSDDLTTSYFVNDDPDLEVYHQIPIYFEIKGIPCKALLDGIVIDKKNSTVKFFDLKSIGRKITYFSRQFLYYKYYLQAAFYQLALNELIEGRAESPVALASKVKNCKLLPPDYVTVHKHPKFSQARVFEVTENDLLVGLNSGYSKQGDYYPGVYELLEDYKWHLDTGNWYKPRRVYQNAGKEPLDLFKPASE